MQTSDTLTDESIQSFVAARKSPDFMRLFGNAFVATYRMEYPRHVVKKQTWRVRDSYRAHLESFLADPDSMSLVIDTSFRMALSHKSETAARKSLTRYLSICQEDFLIKTVEKEKEKHIMLDARPNQNSMKTEEMEKDLSDALQKTENGSMLSRTPIHVSIVSVEDFISLPDHSRQRSVERRLARALKNQFREASPTHTVVHAVKFNGVVHKVDGHTRSAAWSQNLLERPSSLVLVQYECSSAEDYLEIYSHFDSPFAVEGKPDILSGAIKHHDYAVSSMLLKDMNWVSALRIASRSLGAEITDVYTNVDEFIEEIKDLDAQDYKFRTLNRGQLAAYLMIARKHGKDEANSFFGSYMDRKGVKQGSSADGLFYMEAAAQGPTAGSGFSLALPAASITLSCFETWKAGRKIHMFKSPQWDKDDKGNKSVIPRYGDIKIVKIGGYLSGLRNLVIPA